MLFVFFYDSHDNFVFNIQAILFGTVFLSTFYSILPFFCLYLLLLFVNSVHVALSCIDLGEFLFDFLQLALETLSFCLFQKTKPLQLSIL